MDLAPFLFRILDKMPETEVVQQKTQISLKLNGHPYATLYEAGAKAVGLSFFMAERIESPRIRSVVQVRANRFTHHMRLTQPEQLDEELISWLHLAAAWKRGR